MSIFSLGRGRALQLPVFACLISWSLLAVPASGALIVDWGGDYVSADQSYRNIANNQTGQEYGDDATNTDRRAQSPFSTTTLRSPVSGYAGTSDKFYGGFQAWGVIQGGGGNSVNLTAIVDEVGGNDSNSISVSGAFGQNPAKRLFGLWLWKQEDFLSLSGTDVKFDETSSLRLNAETVSSGSSYRFVVQDGSTFYLSSAGYTADKTLTGTELMDTVKWRVYDPATDLRANGASTSGAGGLTYAIDTSSFTDINMVGVYAEKANTTNTSPVFSFTEFEVNAVPEPSTFALAGMGVLLLVPALRRRLA